MTCRIHLAVLALSLVADGMSVSRPARAEDVSVGGRPAAAINESPPVAESTTVYVETTTPDRRKLVGGAIVFGAAYGASMVVAGESVHAGDRVLFAPVAGPWLDLARRGGCPAVGSCGGEKADRALLVGDGLFQAVGVLAIIGGYVLQTTTEAIVSQTTARGATAIRITPIQYSHGGVGLGAIGTF